MKVVFLDIDGVMQGYRQERFKHLNELDEISKELDKKYPGYNFHDYVTLENHPVDEFSLNVRQCNLGAVYFDWSKVAVACLKNILETCKAKIVISSDWKDNGVFVMKSFLAVHELDSYYYGILDGKYSFEPTPEQAKVREFYETIKKERNEFFNDRAADIRQYLSAHPEITSYVALDDLRLGFPVDGHFVHCNDGRLLDERKANLAIEILQKEDGPYPIG